MKKNFLALILIISLLCSCAQSGKDSASSEKHDITPSGGIDWTTMEVINDEASLRAYYDECIRKRMTVIPVLISADYYNSYGTYRFPHFTNNNAYFVDSTTLNDKVGLVITTTYTPGILIADAVKNGTANQLEGNLKEIYDAARAITDEAMKISDPLLREIYLFDAVCDRTVYHSEDPEYGKSWEGLRTLDDYESAEGPLLKGYANCQGYTDAFYLLASMCGYEVEKIRGYLSDKPKKEYAHIWNLIRLGDGEWYMADATTADDDVSIGRYARNYDQLNFGAQDDTMASHYFEIIPTGITIAEHGKDEYGYYRYEDIGAGLRYRDPQSMLNDVCRRFHEGQDVYFRLDYDPGTPDDLLAQFKEHYQSLYGDLPGWHWGGYRTPENFYMHLFHERGSGGSEPKDE